MRGMADPAPVEPTPPEPPTPQPVVRNAFAAGFALIVLSELNDVADHFGWWTMSADDANYWAKLVGLAVGLAIIVRGWVIHKQVMPMVKVERVVAQAKVEGYQQAVGEVQELAAAAGPELPLDPSYQHPEDAAMMAARRAQFAEADAAVRAQVPPPPA